MHVVCSSIKLSELRSHCPEKGNKKPLRTLAQTSQAPTGADIIYFQFGDYRTTGTIYCFILSACLFILFKVVCHS